jgi:hypothetical protein
VPPQEGSQFYQYTSGPSGWGQGDFLRRNAFDLSGIPGFQGQSGMMTGMLLQSILPQILGPNYISAPFMPSGQNLQMHQQVMDFYRQQQRAMELGDRQDQEYRVRALRGVSNMFGVPFGRQQEEAARRFSRDLGTVAPLLAMAQPEVWDQLYGMRGSALVMSQGMFQGGRMGIDPVTGRMGLSADTAAAMTARVQERLYPADTAEAMRRMSGLRMGQAGQMFDEMMQRGLGPAQLDREGVLRELRGRGQQVDRMAPAELDTAVRGFQADRTASQLRQYSGAVKAVQEIFGDMGHPDAPMSQIFNALQALTQGGAGRFSPAELERSVRQTYTIAKMTRLGIDAMSGLMTEAAETAQRQGLDRSFAGPAAAGGALFAQAYGASGAEAAGGWGRLDKAQMARIATRLGVQAAGSDQAVQLGAVAMIADQVGFRGQGAGEANALARAIREGRDVYTFVDPRTRQSVTRSVFMSPGQYNQIMQAGGVNQAVIDELRHSPRAVQESIHQYNVGELVRSNQGRLNIDPFLTGIYRGVASEVLQSGGMNQRDADQLSQAIGAASTQALRGMSQADRADPIRRNRALADSIRQQLGPDRARGLTNEQLSQISVLGWARGTTAIGNPNSPVAGYESMHGMLDAHDQRIRGQAQDMQRQIAGMTYMQSAVAGLGQSGIMARISEAIVNAPQGQDMRDIIAQAMGGVPRSAVTDRVADRVRRLNEVGSRMEGAARAGNQAEVAEMRRQAEELVGQLNRDFEHVPDRPAGRPGGAPATAAPAGGRPATPATPRAGATAAAGGTDAHPAGRGRMEIAGTLRIEWPNTGNLSGHGADPRSANA